jgi:hypothetical protein
MGRFRRLMVRLKMQAGKPLWPRERVYGNPP